MATDRQILSPTFVAFFELAILKNVFVAFCRIFVAFFVAFLSLFLTKKCKFPVQIKGKALQKNQIKQGL